MKRDIRYLKMPPLDIFSTAKIVGRYDGASIQIAEFCAKISFGSRTAYRTSATAAIAAFAYRREMRKQSMRYS